MSQHTPGPWRISSRSMIHGGSVFVARIQLGHLSPDIVDANARLIAAAPEMWHELQEDSRVFRAMAETERIAKRLGSAKALDALADRHNALLAKIEKGP